MRFECCLSVSTDLTLKYVVINNIKCIIKTSDLQQDRQGVDQSSQSTNVKDVQLTDDSWRPDKKVNH